MAVLGEGDGGDGVREEAAWKAELGKEIMDRRRRWGRCYGGGKEEREDDRENEKHYFIF